MELVDLSCADEVVAKLLLAAASGTVRGPARPARGSPRGHRPRPHPSPARRCRVLPAARAPRLLGWVSRRRAEAFTDSGGTGRLDRAALAAPARVAASAQPRTPWTTSPSSHRAASGRRYLSPRDPSREPASAGRSTTAIHGIPHRRAEWSPGGARAHAEQHLHQPGRLRRARCSTAATATTPTRSSWPRSTPLLEGAEDAIFVASGMGGHRAGAPRGAPPRRPSGRRAPGSTAAPSGCSTRSWRRFGIEVTYVSPDQPRLWRKSVRKATRAIFVETPTNPTDAGDRPGADRLRRRGVRPGAAGGRHLRQPDQLPAAGARRRRRHHQRHQVSQRPQRRDRRRGGRLAPRSSRRSTG